MSSGSAVLIFSYFLAVCYISQNLNRVQSFSVPHLKHQQQSITRLYSDKSRRPGGRTGGSSGAGGRGAGRGRGASGPKADYRNKNSVGTTGRNRKNKEDEGIDSTWMPISTKWRLFNIDVLLENDPGKDVYTVHEGLINSIHKSLGILIDTKRYLSSSASSSSSSASKQVWSQKGETEEDDEEHSAFLKATKASSNPADDRNTDNLRVKPGDITILRKVPALNLSSSHTDFTLWMSSTN